MSCVPSVDLDMLHISHAKKAQDLATETTYRTVLHEYTSLPTDMNVSWAKKAYGLQSDVSLPIKMPLCQEKNFRLTLPASFYVETIQVRSDLDEGHRMGSFRIPGRPAGKKGRRAHQRGRKSTHQCILIIHQHKKTTAV